MITIDLSDVLLYLIPFVIIYVFMYKKVFKILDVRERVPISILITAMIYTILYMLSDLNFKIQL